MPDDDPMTEDAPVVDPDATPPEPPRGEFRQAKPSNSWPEEIRYLLRFYVAAKGEKLPPCPVCQSRKRGRWTMLCPFSAKTFGPFTLIEGGEHAPLTLVCSEHPISPTAAIMKAL